MVERITKSKIFYLIAFIIIVVVSIAMFMDDKDNELGIIQDVPKDAIPPLDNPEYESVALASEWILPGDGVLGVEFGGDARAYPLKIMNWHEIVNETIGGKDVVVTYCPLCKSGIVFDRSLDGQVLTFGNTGALFESSMVMYDRQTETYWWQAGARAIKGEFTGKALTILPSNLTSWEEWVQKYPETMVLSINTGFNRDYLGDPYIGYDSPNSSPAFPVSRVDDRLPNKELIIGIVVNGDAKAYPVNLASGKVISDKFNGKEIEIAGDSKGTSAEAFFIENGERIKAPVINEFWFSWAVAHPDTEVYGL